MHDRYDDLLRGADRFAGDLVASGVLHLVFVRATTAHARLASVGTAAAQAAPGVVAVFTARDLHLIPLWEIAIVPEHLAQPPLADGVVRYVGERIAAVLATSLAEAVDAAERVTIEYELLDAVVATDAASAPGAPILFAGQEDNVCLSWPAEPAGRHWPAGQHGPAEPAGRHVVRVAHEIPRLCVAPLEGHAVLAVPGADGSVTLHVSTQVPAASRAQVARTLAMDPAQVRVVAPAVGGGFGGKAAGAVGEHMVAAAAARRLGRPVRFVEDRNDNLVTMQGRGVRNVVELQATDDGRVVGMVADIVCDAGAYPNVGAVEPGKTQLMACGPYRIPVATVRARSVMTNLAPVGAYRGPGRSEASVMLERTLDVLAADLGIDPVEIRRRNLIAADEFPYRTPTGLEYDCGDLAALLDRLVEVTGYDELRAAQHERRGAGGASLIGIGVSLVLDSTAWFSRTEGAAVSVDADGTVVVRAGSAPSGQHHEVVYRTIVQRLLPVAASRIRVIEGDTAEWARSDGTMGSRTTQLAGTAVLRATTDVVHQLRSLAAADLEAALEDIVVHDGGVFAVRGVPTRTRTLAQLAATALRPGGPGRPGAAVEASCVHEQDGATYPAAAHLSVVEVDRETGRVRALRHVAVTDCGTVLDPASATGQVVGACVQGMGQALYEQAVHDDAGTPLTVSLADYGMPAAPDVPMIETHFLATPSPRNPLGAKGVGEIGMIGAPVAVQNAVVDALRHLGVRHLDMPCTPARVWSAVRSMAARNDDTSDGPW